MHMFIISSHDLKRFGAGLAVLVSFLRLQETHDGWIQCNATCIRKHLDIPPATQYRYFQELLKNGLIEVEYRFNRERWVRLLEVEKKK